MAVRLPGMGMNASTWNAVVPGAMEHLDIDNEKFDEQGITKIRVGSTDPSFGGATQTVKDVAQYYLNKNKYVIAGVTKVKEVEPLTAANKEAHRQAILDFANWGDSVGLSEIMIGNEELHHIDGTTFTEADAIQFFLDMGEEVKSLYPSLVVNYAIVADKITTWAASGLVPGVHWDRPSINIYGSSAMDVDDFEQQIVDAKNAWGSSMYISEWGPFWDWNQVPTDQALQAYVVHERLKRIKKHDVENIFFTWKFHNTNDPAGWNKFALWSTTGTPTHPNTEWVPRQMYFALFDDPIQTNYLLMINPSSSPPLALSLGMM